MIPLTMNETQNFHLNGMKFSFFQKGRWESWPLCVVRCPPSSFLSRPLWQPFSFLFKFSSLTTAVSVTSQVYWEKEPICSSCLSPSGYHSAAMGRCWPEAIQGFRSAPRRQGWGLGEPVCSGSHRLSPRALQSSAVPMRRTWVAGGSHSSRARLWLAHHKRRLCLSWSLSVINTFSFAVRLTSALCITGEAKNIISRCQQSTWNPSSLMCNVEKWTSGENCFLSSTLLFKKGGVTWLPCGWTLPALLPWLKWELKGSRLTLLCSSENCKAGWVNYSLSLGWIA